MKYRRPQNNSGFTIVELLIVIVVIGILAAIVIVAYRGIQNRAYDTSVQSDMKTNANLLLQFEAINSRFPSSVAELQGVGLKFTKSAYASLNPRSNSLTYCSIPSGDNRVFALGGSSKSNGAAYYYSSKDGLKTTSWWGEVGNAGLCPTLGVDSGDPGYFHQWGYTAGGGWSSWANG